MSGSRPAGARLGRRGGRLGRRHAGGAGAPRPAARDRLPAGHRRAAAAVRRRSLRGRRGAAVPGPELGGGRPLRGGQRGGRARGRFARAAGCRARQPPRDGPCGAGARPRGGAVRGQDPRQRAGVHGQAVPALPPVRARGARRRARGAGRLAPHGREPVGGDGRPGAARPAPASARRGWTSRASRRASRPRRTRGCGACARGWRRRTRGERAAPRPPATRSPGRPARRPRRSPPSLRTTGSWSSSAS